MEQCMALFSGLWSWVLEHIEQKYQCYRVALMVDASHIKAHQEATRSPLSASRTETWKNQRRQEYQTQCILPSDLCGCFVLADKAYDTNEIRDSLHEQQAFAVIPPKRNRKTQIAYDKEIGKLLL